MKKFAEIKNNLIVNIAKFENDAEVPDGWIDVTDIKCCHGDPVDGVPIPKPSRYHTLDGLEWVITVDAQIESENTQLETERIIAISVEKENTGLKNINIEQAYDLIDNQLDPATTNVQLKESLRVILKKIIPFVL